MSKLTLVPALAFVALAACAPARSAGVTSTTAADVPGGPSADAPTAKAAERETAGATRGDQGELVCRATDAYGVTSELRVTWRGKVGEGTLRQLAPSGMTSETRIRAEREGDVLFADDVKSEPDLLVHAASVTRKDGKGYIRLGDAKQPWSRCE